MATGIASTSAEQATSSRQPLDAEDGRALRHGQPSMRHALAALWLVIVVGGGRLSRPCLASRAFRSAPTCWRCCRARNSDPVLKQANEAVSRSLGRRFVLAFGDVDRGRARTGGTAGEQGGRRHRRWSIQLDSAALQDRRPTASASFYLPHRDAAAQPPPIAARSEQGRADDIANRALAQALGFGSPVDADAACRRSVPAAAGVPRCRCRTCWGRLVARRRHADRRRRTATTWVVVPMTPAAQPVRPRRTGEAGHRPSTTAVERYSRGRCRMCDAAASARSSSPTMARARRSMR